MTNSVAKRNIKQKTNSVAKRNIKQAVESVAQCNIEQINNGVAKRNIERKESGSLSQGEILTIMQQAIYTILKVGAPMMITALVVGLLISIFQAMTQINEQTLVFVPKILAVLLALVLFGSWMMTTLIEFTVKLFDSLPTLLS